MEDNLVLISSTPQESEPAAAPERWSSLMDEIAADAESRAAHYPSQSLVPEGGE